MKLSLNIQIIEMLVDFNVVLKSETKRIYNGIEDVKHISVKEGDKLLVVDGIVYVESGEPKTYMEGKNLLVDSTTAIYVMSDLNLKFVKINPTIFKFKWL